MPKPIQILIVEDEAAIRTLLIQALQTEFVVFAAKDFISAEAYLNNKPIDLILLDWMLPRQNGLQLIYKWRKHPTWTEIPIIMVTAKSDETDMVHALQAGADDYLIKPFSIKNLIARIHSVLRRVNLTQSKGIIKLADIVLNQETLECFIDNTRVNIRRMEFLLLNIFCQNPDKVFSREKLLRLLSTQHKEVNERTIDAHIRSLRKLLGKERSYIETIYGIGYKFTIH